MEKEDMDRLNRLKELVLQASEILKENDELDLAQNLLLNTGFAIGMALRNNPRTPANDIG